jgi:nondiscriminating glutamyl-tRNA synthetase
MSREVRVRYAPSPTGHLHIGGARTALFDYLLARNQNGKFIIRIEDTDQSRHVETGIESQLSGLKWLGLEWDESVDIGGPYGPYRQMERLSLYQPFIDQLLSEKNAYYCYCTEEEIEASRAEQEAQGLTPVYSGKCRHLEPSHIEQYKQEGRKAVLRFRVSEDQVVAVDDHIRGHVEFDSNGVGDFIIVRPDGIPTYNFAVVLDDHLMEITHVIRGEEHLSNTPRQLLLYQALGLQPPEFAHISLILNKDRKKMSKRDESIMQFIEQYKELGYLPEAVLNYIVLLGWSPKGEEEIFTRDELIEQFGLDRIQKSPAVFDTEKLDWMNNHYIKQAEISRMVDLIIPHLEKAGYISTPLNEEGKIWVEALVQLLKDQLRYAAEIIDVAKIFFEDEISFDEETEAVLSEEQVPVVLQSFLSKVESNDEFAAMQIKTWLKEVQKDTGFKGKQLFMPIRSALTAQVHGPDLIQSVSLLGKEKVIQRLKARL